MSAQIAHVDTPPQMPFGIASGKRFNKAAQAIAATIRICGVHGAIERKCFADIASNWTDLLSAVGMRPSALAFERTEWDVMVKAIVHALHGGPDAELRWAAADEHVRAYARQSAAAWTATARTEQGDDHWDDVEPARQLQIQDAHTKAAQLTAFAAGRA